MTTARQLAPLFMAEKEEPIHQTVKANYLQSLNDASAALSALQLQNPFLPIESLTQSIQDEREKVRSYPDRLIPLDLESNEGGKTDPQGSRRKSTRLNSSHTVISYAVFCLKKKKQNNNKKKTKHKTQKKKNKQII